MTKGFTSKRIPIEEHHGFRVGDSVRLTAPACPRVVGRISRIFPDRFAGNEISFSVSLQNPLDRGVTQEWSPMYSDQIEKA
jgi:hypothetical protein